MHNSIAGTPAISVIICAYSEDRWSNLMAAVESLRNQTLSPREIIVIVDHNPKLLERTRDLTGVIGAANTESPGLSGARNSGVALAQGEILAFLDDDAVAGPNWLAQLQLRYQDSSVAGVSGVIEPMWPGQRPAWFPIEFDWVVGCTYLGLPETVAPVRNMIGANMSFRREVFSAVGGFRRDMGRVRQLPAGCEETELCIRARQHRPGWILLYDPNAGVAHQVTVNRTRWAYFQARCFSEGRSKALVTQFVGAQDGLATERNYTLRILPQGIVRNLAAAVLGHDLNGLRRATVIVLGLAITMTGYMSGLIVNGFNLQPPTPAPSKAVA